MVLHLIAYSVRKAERIAGLNVERNDAYVLLRAA
jgi:hypothetical protein